ncbi:MAG TPA: hypothetical protein DCK95_09215 [Anaerolineaceae bacterium]|nr:hypothetical protein [Anaerolineaceae bacterium]
MLFEAMDDHGEAMFTVETIRSLLEAKQAKGGEIAIMYRTNAQSRLLEEAFFQSRMPYRLVGAQRFYGRQEVKDMIAFLRTVQNPADEVSLLRVINLPPRGIGDKTLQDLRTAADQAGVRMGSLLLDLGTRQDSSTYWNILSGRAASALAAFGALLVNWRELNQSILLPELFERILKDTNYQEYIMDASDVGYSRWENVQELLRMAYEYSQVGLVGFLENLALVSDQDTLPEKSEAPTLLTLHAAKGLEYKVVFIVGLDEGLLPHRRSMEDPEEMAEERRLFYVGITRAKDHLYLVRADQRRNYGSFDYSVPSRFLEDIPEKLIHRAGVQYRHYSTPSKPSSIPRWNSAPEKKKKETAKQTAQFSAGMHVHHAALGNGIVIQSKLQGDDEIVTVAFDQAGLKKLSAAIAKLEIV